MKKTSLGTGLSSLIPEKTKRFDSDGGGVSTNHENEVIKVAVDQIIPNPNQPRYFFDGENR